MRCRHLGRLLFNEHALLPHVFLHLISLPQGVVLAVHLGCIVFVHRIGTSRAILQLQTHRKSLAGLVKVVCVLNVKCRVVEFLSLHFALVLAKITASFGFS